MIYMNATATKPAAKVGDRFRIVRHRLWTHQGADGDHVVTFNAIITDVDHLGVTYHVTHVISEAGAPPETMDLRVVRPLGGSALHDAVGRYITDGEWTRLP